MTTSFQQATLTGGEYLWSTAANWVGDVVPGNGAAVIFDTGFASNPSGYDDISSLTLDSLDVVSGFAAVGASLTIGTLSFGSTVASVFSDTDLGAASATLNIDGFGGATGGRVGAFGANALTNVLSATDPGEIYQVDGGGELVLNATPLPGGGPTNAGFYYQNSHGTGELPSGTFAFRDPGNTVSALLSAVAIGDSIALPGSDVASVTFGTNSLSVVTNLGTTTFSDVTYLAGATPTGFTVSTDPSGLQRVTFTSQQTDSFQQVTQTGGEYLWSTTANWVGGVVPGDGAAVTFNTGFGSNPSGYDDISSLALDSLNVVSGFAAVGASLSIGTLSFGSTIASVFSDTDLGAASATLNIDGFGGATGGRVGAFGSNALTNVLSATDPGEIYQVDEGGELVLSATPLPGGGPTNAGFYYQNSHGTGELPSGTFAFRQPGSTVSALLSAVAIGDSLALPGSDVASVTFGTNSLSVVTNLGTTTFSDVTYLAGATPTGFSVSTDPSGLERVTFTSQQTVSFQQVTQTGGEYLWSTTANWVGGAVPGDGAAVTFNTGFGSNPSGYDDISSLALDSLNVVSGFAAVGASLSIGTLSFGSTSASVFSDTDLGSPAATLTIDGFSGATGGRVGAFGSNALTNVLSATDPGEIYQVDEGGELVLSATPLPGGGPTNAGFYYQNSHGTGQLPSGTFAFRDPGATVTSLLSAVAIGDSIALPGSDVASVTFGANSLSVVTNLGTTTFSDATYLAGATPTGFIAAADPITGLERVTFTSQQTDSFQQVTQTGGEYLWSTTANWVGGVVPGDGAAVTFNTGFGSNPSGFDDITSLALDSLNVVSGFAAVGASLSIGTLSFGSTIASVFSDTDLGSPAATLTIDGFSGATGGRVGAFGDNALTNVLSATDPGEIYQVDEGGELVLSATPLPGGGPTNAGFYYQNSHGTGELPSGTFAFRDPGATVTSLLSAVAIGDSIELPGSDVASVTYGANTLSVVTNLGTTTFSDVTYLAGSTPMGHTATPDASTGLERITFALCFCEGSLIQTASGEISVENLAVGDTVVTWRGEHRPITWIGVGRVLATRGRRNAATPVIVQKGALADNVPHADLRVTKGHSLFIDGVLIPVEFLVNHRSIQWDDRAQEVSVYHVELATHDVLIANGAPAESYRDDGNRWLFGNANPTWDATQQDACAPVLTGGAIVDQVWQRLLDRAGPRPGVPLTGDPDLHLLVDGMRVDAASQHGYEYVFRLPERPRSVRIRSRSTAPQELGLARDPRQLGVALTRLMFAQGARLNVIEADDACLADGYHDYEPVDAMRWTDGDAVVPAALYAGTTAAGTLHVYLGCTAQYADEGYRRQAA